MAPVGLVVGLLLGLNVCPLLVGVVVGSEVEQAQLSPNDVQVAMAIPLLMQLSQLEPHVGLEVGLSVGLAEGLDVGEVEGDSVGAVVGNHV